MYSPPMLSMSFFCQKWSPIDISPGDIGGAGSPIPNNSSTVSTAHFAVLQNIHILFLLSADVFISPLGKENESTW